MKQGACKGHTMDFCRVLKGMSWTYVHAHHTNMCKCDSISFLDREESHKDVGNNLNYHFFTTSIIRNGAYKA